MENNFDTGCGNLLSHRTSSMISQAIPTQNRECTFSSAQLKLILEWSCKWSDILLDLNFVYIMEFTWNIAFTFWLPIKIVWLILITGAGLFCVTEKLSTSVFFLQTRTGHPDVCPDVQQTAEEHLKAHFESSTADRTHEQEKGS